MKDVVSLIRTKRDGKKLDPDEIRYLINGIADQTIPDYQAAAFLMATYLKGMDQAEARALTEAMMHSGDILDLSGIDGFTCDKHSTGGVGDKITMIIAPMAAALGIKVPMYSGRGLGHTGGTIDKLDSVPGFQSTLENERFMENLQTIGIANSMQTDRIAPADKILYALRDVTATVDSIPLITGSIMSKKLACGAGGLVLDVKFGKGAFMQTQEAAKELADWLIQMAPIRNIPVSALIDRMDQPLGYMVGNALEMKESIQVLQGADIEDLVEVSVAIVREMLILAGNSDNAEARALATLKDGSALTMFRRWMRSCGGDDRVVDEPDRFPASALRETVCAEANGYVQCIDAMEIGLASVYLGAGRLTKTDTLDLGTGIELHVKQGDPVETGQPLATIHYSQTRKPLTEIRRQIVDAISLESEPKARESRIVQVIRGN